MRLRSKHRLLLRGANASKTVISGANLSVVDQALNYDANAMVTQSCLDYGLSTPLKDTQHVPDPDTMTTASSHEGEYFESSATIRPCVSVPPESAVGQPTIRKDRLCELQKDSDDRWESKKRRRRTRGWAGLPADPPGPPRFPSETTLESSKSCLGLENASYLEIRARFQDICQKHQISKKTTAGPDRWQAAKSQLIQSHPHLQQVFQMEEQPQLDQMRLSLDVICMDVTKRLRTMEHQMTLAEAKNLLDINPEEGRRLRQALMDTLTLHNFVNKHESGNWEQLKQIWMAETGLNDRIPAIGSPAYEQSLRAVQVICRDIMKRWRDAQVALGKTEGPVRPRVDGEQLEVARHSPPGVQRSREPSDVPEEFSEDAPGPREQAVDANYDFQIDPTLLKEQGFMLQNPYADGVVGP